MSFSWINVLSKDRCSPCTFCLNISYWNFSILISNMYLLCFVFKIVNVIFLIKFEYMFTSKSLLDLLSNRMSLLINVNSHHSKIHKSLPGYPVFIWPIFFWLKVLLRWRGHHRIHRKSTTLFGGFLLKAGRTTAQHSSFIFDNTVVGLCK